MSAKSQAPAPMCEAPEAAPVEEAVCSASNASLASEVDGDTDAPATPLLDDAEYNLFVNGTYSRGPKDTEGYWNDGVEDSANELLGAETGEEFDWFGGPNDKRARRIAGRMLLQDAVLPAFERGETVNLIAHSHGGNVVGEMTAALDARIDYLGALEAGLTAPPGSGEHSRALQVLEDRLAALEDERSSMESVRPQAGEFEGGSNLDIEGSRAEMLTQLDREIDETLRHHATLLGESGGAELAEEKKVLENGDFGDVLMLNPPYLEDHASVLDSEQFMSTVDSIHDFDNEQDKVVLGAQSHQCSLDKKQDPTLEADCTEPPIPHLTTGREDHPQVTRTTWERRPEESVSITDYEEYSKQDHNLHVNNPDVFNRVVRGAVEEGASD